MVHSLHREDNFQLLASHCVSCICPLALKLPALVKMSKTTKNLPQYLTQEPPLPERVMPIHPPCCR